MIPLRLFVAVEFPPALQILLRQHLERLTGCVPAGLVRWTRPENLHLTLKFLGDTAPGRVDEIAGMLTMAAQGSGSLALEVGGLGYFPSPRQPQVMWLGVREAEGKLAALQRRVEEGAAQLGYPPEERAFSPHLTLGRAAKTAGSAEKRQIAEALAGQDIPALGQVSIRHLILFRSELRPAGSVYTKLRTVTL